MEDAGATTSAAANMAEAERLLGIAEKLLHNRDLTGSREFAVLAQETEPLLEGSDQILAISDVLIAGDRRVNNQFDWYSIIGVERRSDNPDLIKKSYRRLALLLHPDKNKFPLSDAAFKLVADAWAVLSDPLKKSRYDAELTLFSRVDLGPKPPPPAQPQPQPQPQPHFQHNKLPVRRSPRGGGPGGPDTNSIPDRYEAAGVAAPGRMGVGSSSRSTSFWTACPYCYILYEYPTMYEECCLRCQNCQRAFHAAVVPSLPPRVPGKEAYYCCWGFFPLGFSIADSETGKNPNSGWPNWMPPMFSTPASAPPPAAAAAPQSVPSRTEDGRVDLSDGSGSARLAHGLPVPPPPGSGSGPKKRGRPRKNPL